MPSAPSYPLRCLPSRFLLFGRNSPVGNEKKSSRLNEINGFATMPIEVIRRRRKRMKGGGRMRSGLVLTFFRLCGHECLFFIVECSTSNSISVKSRICASRVTCNRSCDIQGFVKFRSAMLELQKIKAIGGELWIGFSVQVRARNLRFVETTICRTE